MEHQAIYPLYKVEQIETDIPQLSHLRCVYLFVVDCVRWQALALACEDNAKEVNRSKSLKGNKVVVNDSHNRIKNRYKGKQKNDTTIFLPKNKCISRH